MAELINIAAHIPVIEIKIELMPNGQIRCCHPQANLLIVIGLLETAKQSILAQMSGGGNVIPGRPLN